MHHNEYSNKRVCLLDGDVGWYIDSGAPAEVRAMAVE